MLLAIFSLYKDNFLKLLGGLNNNKLIYSNITNIKVTSLVSL